MNVGNNSILSSILEAETQTPTRQEWADECIRHATGLRNLINIDNECIFQIDNIQFKRTSHIWLVHTSNSNAFHRNNCSHVPETYMALLQAGDAAEIPSYVIPWNKHTRTDYDSVTPKIHVNDEKLLLINRAGRSKDLIYNTKANGLTHDKESNVLNSKATLSTYVPCLYFFTRLKEYMQKHPCPLNTDSICVKKTKFITQNREKDITALADNLMYRTRDQYFVYEEYKQKLNTALSDHKETLPQLLEKYDGNITPVDINLPVLLPDDFIPHISWYNYFTKYNNRAVPGWQLIHTNEIKKKDEYMLYYLYSHVKIAIETETIAIANNDYYSCAVRE